MLYPAELPVRTVLLYHIRVCFASPDEQKTSSNSCKMPDLPYQDQSFSSYCKKIKLFRKFFILVLTNANVSVIITDVENIAASPSGKATDSDSVIP